jgi:hypothetical protein
VERPEAYRETRARVDAWARWAEQFKGRNGWTVIHAEAAAAAPVKVTNEERSAVEVYEVTRDKPERLTAYVQIVDLAGQPSGHTDRNVTRGCYVQVTTWTGDILGSGRVTSLESWRSNMGDWRFSVRVQIAGAAYVGTAANGSGGCINLRKARS